MSKSGQRQFTKKFIRKVAAIFLASVSFAFLSFAFLSVNFPFSHSSVLSPAFAQRFDPNTVWQQVYEKLPDLPLENQYINRETGKAVPDNTLVGRFIRYHIYVKGRPPVYRLDWKLTLADYLGINEFIDAAIYPSSDTLTTNPTAGDIAAIGSLNRVQRDALVQTIFDIFNSTYTDSSPSSPQDTRPAPASPRSTPDSTSSPPPSLREPQPGDADLLLP